MRVQTTHRFSVEDYYRMAETGVLRPDARVELLDGEIKDMSPIGPFHGGVTKFLNRFFSDAAKGRWITSVQDPVRLDDHSEPQPDVALLKPSPDLYRKRHPKPSDVWLVIEVADASLATDREQKLPAYGRAGIAEVWIVNLIDETVEVYREPQFDGYASTNILRAGDTAKPLSFPDAGIDVGALLKR